MKNKTSRLKVNLVFIIPATVTSCTILFEIKYTHCTLSFIILLGSLFLFWLISKVINKCLLIILSIVTHLVLNETT